MFESSLDTVLEPLLLMVLALKFWLQTILSHNCIAVHQELMINKVQKLAT